MAATNPNVQEGMADPNCNVSVQIADPNPCMPDTNPNPNHTHYILYVALVLVNPGTPDARVWALTLNMAPYLHT
jgi:hypothetical protein